MAFFGNILLLNEIDERNRSNEFPLYQKHLRDTNNPFEFNFKKLYRLPKNTIMLIEILRPLKKKIEAMDLRSKFK